MSLAVSLELARTSERPAIVPLRIDPSGPICGPNCSPNGPCDPDDGCNPDDACEPDVEDDD